MNNLALPSLRCTEAVPMASIGFEAAAPFVPGIHQLTVRMEGYTAGSWMVTLAGGSASSGPVNEDCEVTIPIDVTTINNNEIRIVARAQPGGKLTILNLEGPAAA
jgi:hypothetical protein